MIFDRMDHHPGARLLLMGASVVVVVAGLKVAAPILLPFALGLFLAVLSLPVMFWLQLRRVPAPVAIGLTVLMNIALFGVLILLAYESVSEFQTQLPRYNQRLQDLVRSWLVALADRGVPLEAYITPQTINQTIDPGVVLDFIGGTIQRAAVLLGKVFLVFLIMAFILGEATVFPFKFRAILGPEIADRQRITKIIAEVQEYLGIKTLVSLATGLCIGIWAYVMNLDFPILLGLIGFLLNYIPTIGSVIAAIPALLLSLVQVGTLGHFIGVSSGYVVVNLVFGNLIEPNLLGRRLGISTLVVILSLVFWGWLWGPVGALLAVPLTMVVKIMLENTHDLRWMAILLDKAPPQAADAGGALRAEVAPVDVDAEAEGGGDGSSEEPLEAPDDPRAVGGGSGVGQRV